MVHLGVYAKNLERSAPTEYIASPEAESVPRKRLCRARCHAESERAVTGRGESGAT